MLIIISNAKDGILMQEENTVVIRPLSLNDAKRELVLQTENRMFFEQFAMSRQEDFIRWKAGKNELNNH